MEITVLPFERLKARQCEFDVIVTVLDTRAQRDPFYRLDKYDDQLVIRCYCDDLHATTDAWGTIPTAPRIEQFRNIVNNARKFVSTDKHVGIACMAGISRSSATALMILAVKYQSASRAIKELQSLKRSDEFWPNTVITHYADVLLNMGGSLDTALAEYVKSKRSPVYLSSAPKPTRNSALDYIHSLHNENTNKPWAWIKDEQEKPQYQEEWYMNRETGKWTNRNDQK